MEINPFTQFPSDKPPEDLRKQTPQKRPLDPEVAKVIKHPIEPYSTRKHKEAQVEAPVEAKLRSQTASSNEHIQMTWTGPRESEHSSIRQQYERTKQHLETISPPEEITDKQRQVLMQREQKLKEFLANPYDPIGKPEPLSRQQHWDISVANERQFNAEQKVLKRYTLDQSGEPVEIPRDKAKYVMTALDELKAIRYALNQDADKEEESIADVSEFLADTSEHSSRKTYMLNIPDHVLDPSKLAPSMRPYYEAQANARVPRAEDLMASGAKPNVKEIILCGAPTASGEPCKSPLQQCRHRSHRRWREEQDDQT